MDEIQDLQLEAPKRETAAHFLAALFEILLVAVSGSLLVQVGLGLLDIGSSRILADSGFLFLFMSLEASITLFLILVFLHSRGQRLGNLGWNFREAGREVLLGVSFVPLLFGSTFLVGAFFELVLPEYVSTTNPLLDLVRDYRDLVFFLISSIYVGGLKEEVQRAFVLDRFERYWGLFLLKMVSLFTGQSPPADEVGRRLGLVLGLILWSLFFAVGHAVQGVANAAGAGVLGMLFGLLYIWRRNLVAPMVAHALYDITTLVTFWNFLKS